MPEQPSPYSPEFREGGSRKIPVFKVEELIPQIKAYQGIREAAEDEEIEAQLEYGSPTNTSVGGTARYFELLRALTKRFC